MKRNQKVLLSALISMLFLMYSLPLSVFAKSIQYQNTGMLEILYDDENDQIDIIMFSEEIIELMRDSNHLKYVSDQKYNNNDIIEKSIDLFIKKITNERLIRMPPALLHLRDEYRSWRGENSTTQRLNKLIEEFEQARYSEQFNKEVKELEDDSLASKDKRFIIKYKNKSDESKVAEAIKQDIKSIRKINTQNNKRLDVVTVNGKLNEKDILNKLKDKNSDLSIEYIQEDIEFTLSSYDKLFNSQWGIYNNSTTQDSVTSSVYSFVYNITNDSFRIDANVVPAWDKSLGEDIVVAVIDTGIDKTHEDLAENIWVNTKETINNDIDDNDDGYCDDVNGWNFVDWNNKVYDVRDVNNEEHGTHIAGIIAAIKDNEKGIAGVAPKAKIMPLKVFKNGTAYTSDIIEAIKYAESHGAKIVNCSWGTTEDNPALKEAIEDSSMLFICAAGNYGSNIDNSTIYPASYKLSNVITVASMNKNGFLSATSNYGEDTIDVAAPGEDIYSTLPGNTYGSKYGTSMAAGFVSGEAALIWSLYRKSDAAEIRNRIINTSDRISSLTDKVNRSNKVNCGNVVNDIVNTTIKDIINDNNSTIINSVYYQQPGLSLFSGAFMKIEAGYYHTIALKNDGTAWTWGENSYGQLGDGTVAQRLIPAQVTGLTGVIDIAAGSDHTIALKNDGTVWAWGYNYYGQLGDGTTTDRLSPVQISGMTGVIGIAAGTYHTLILKNDGTVWSCGSNGSGQLGDGTTTDRLSPVQVSGITGVSGIAAHTYHTLILKNDGTVWSCGSNGSGQLGDGTTTDRLSPVQVSGMTGVIGITAGYNYSDALKNDGTVWTWGYNRFDGTRARLSPVQLSGLAGVIGIVASYSHTVILKNDGTTWTWGYNRYGQLGDGTTTDRLSPVQVNGLTGVIGIAAGYYHTVALKNDGTVWVWGSNTYGQLGDGTLSQRVSPTQVTSLTGVIDTAAGDNYTVALKNDGTVWTWGSNTYGQLGDGTLSQRVSPIQVTSLAGVIDIAAGSDHTVVLKNDGTVWTWGENSYGQLGNGTSTAYEVSPVQVSGLTGVIGIAAGSVHTVILKNDGTVWAWGCNIYGQLGNGTSTAYEVSPVQVSGLTGVIGIAAGNSHTVALKNDGTVWTWGSNSLMQLGDMNGYRSIPAQVSGLTGVIGIAAGSVHTVILKNDGTVWACGSNEYGQLGDGTTTPFSFGPVQVTGLTGVIGIAAGNNHTIVLKNDGTVWTWGSNGYGQLGDGSSAPYSNISVQVSGMTGVIGIAAGYNHTVALKKDGTVWTWGDNSCGELGNAYYYDKLIPVLAKFDFQLDIPSNLTYSSASTQIILVWDSLEDASDYDLEVDGMLIYNGNSTSFTHSGLRENSQHTYRVRARYYGIVGNWSNLLSCETFNGNLLLNCLGSKIYQVVITASTVQNLSTKTYIVTYNKDQLEVVDLCANTSDVELSAGSIPGTNITINEYNPDIGTIQFTVDLPIDQGKVWSGLINAIKFRANPNFTGQSTVRYEIQ